MKRHLRKMAVAVLLLTGGLLSANTDPAINFSIAAPQNGIIKSWSPGVSIKVGAATEIINGPFGGKALKFNGLNDSICTLQLGSEAAGLRSAKNISISLALRLDRAAGEKNTGLGIVLDGDHFSFSDGTFKLPAKTVLKENRWYQIALIYSADRKEAKIYVDGVLDNALMNQTLSALNIPFGQIGGFDGAVASIQVWDRALTDKEMLQVTTDDAGLNTLRNRIEELERNVKLDSVKTYLDEIAKKIVQTKNQRRISIQTQERTAALGMTALSLAENEWRFRNTALENAPFALMQVQATAPYLRSAYLLPEDALYTTEIGVAAAKGEQESFSFVIHPYQDIQDFTVTVSDFKTKDGKTLPSGILDRKVVKNWYQADWNSQYNNSVQVLVPDLLLNDDALVRADEAEGKNYLRVGGKYVDVSGTEKDSFNYCKEDVQDAESLKGVNLKSGLNKQFWFTVAVPENAKQGLYSATAAVSGNGKPLGSFKIVLRVYPFTLPAPMTSYDRSAPYSVTLIGTDLTRYQALSDDSTARKMLAAELKNLKEHGIANPALPYAKDVAAFEAELKIRKDLGFDMKGAFIAAVPDDGSLMTKVGFKGNTADSAAAGKALAGVEKIAGHKDVIFYGDPGLVSGGMNVLTYGNPDEAALLPSVKIYHAQPYAPDDYLTEKWHALHGKIYSCGYLFAGPDNPDIMRRTFGVTLYRANYDGFLLPAYPAAHCWNERAQTGIYRNQTLAYPVKNGFVNTIAFAGLREAVDDVRYLTLLRSLLDEAFRTKNQEAIYAGKKAVSVFELMDTRVINLDLMRMEIADHIVTIMKRLGKEID